MSMLAHVCVHTHTSAIMSVKDRCQEGITGCGREGPWDRFGRAFREAGPKDRENWLRGELWEVSCRRWGLGARKVGLVGTETGTING